MTGSTATAAATPAPPRTDASPAADHGSRRRWLILAVVAISQLMVVLDATIVNIALPTAQADIGFGNEDRQWIVTGYALAFGSLLLVGGRLADLYGRRLLFLIGLVGFAAASGLGGAANSFDVLVSARILQGIFGALLAPAALSLLAVTFPSGPDRAKAFAVFGAISGAGGAVGLILGGALTEYLSWHWCLLVNIPIAVVAVIGALTFLPTREPRAKDAPGLDVPGSLLSIAGLVSLVYGLGTAETDGWTAVSTLSFIGAGIALLALFTWVETRVAAPLLPLRVVLDRRRGGSYLTVGIVGIGMFGLFLFLTYYMAQVLGFEPLKTGLSFVPMIVSLVVAAQLSTPIVNRIGVKVPVIMGSLIAAAGMTLFTRLGLDSSYGTDVLPGLIIVGLGIGFVMAPAFGAGTSGVDASDAGVASAALNTFQQIGGSMGTAVLSALAASAFSDALVGRDPADPLARAEAALSQYHTVFWASAIVFLAAAIICGALLPHGATQVDPDAEPVFAH